MLNCYSSAEIIGAKLICFNCSPLIFEPINFTFRSAQEQSVFHSLKPRKICSRAIKFIPFPKLQACVDRNRCRVRGRKIPRDRGGKSRTGEIGTHAKIKEEKQKKKKTKASDSFAISKNVSKCVEHRSPRPFKTMITSIDTSNPSHGYFFTFRDTLCRGRGGRGFRIGTTVST